MTSPSSSRVYSTRGRFLAGTTVGTKVILMQTFDLIVVSMAPELRFCAPLTQGPRFVCPGDKLTNQISQPPLDHVSQLLHGDDAFRAQVFLGCDGVLSCGWFHICDVQLAARPLVPMNCGRKGRCYTQDRQPVTASASRRDRFFLGRGERTRNRPFREEFLTTALP